MATITINNVSMDERVIAVTAVFNDATIQLTWTETVRFNRDEVSECATVAQFRDNVALPKFTAILDKYKKLKVAKGWLDSKIGQEVSI